MSKAYKFCILIVTEKILNYIGKISIWNGLLQKKSKHQVSTFFAQIYQSKSTFASINKNRIGNFYDYLSKCSDINVVIL